jgi:hypothetical protein
MQFDEINRVFWGFRICIGDGRMERWYVDFLEDIIHF